MSDPQPGFVPPAGQEPSGGEPQTPDVQGAEGGARPNLDDNPDFRNWKTKVNQTIAERDRKMMDLEKRYNQQQAEYNARMAQMEEEMERRVMEGLDEFGQMQYRAQSEAKKRAALEKQINDMQQERSREEFIGALRDRYGVAPSDESHPVMALTSVTDALYKRVSELEAEVEKYKRESGARAAALDDAPDLGGGAPVHPVSDIQRAYNEAMLKMDGATADRLSRQASQQGLNLDRMAFIKMRGQRSNNAGQ